MNGALKLPQVSNGFGGHEADFEDCSVQLQKRKKNDKIKIHVLRSFCSSHGMNTDDKKTQNKVFPEKDGKIPDKDRLTAQAGYHSKGVQWEPGIHLRSDMGGVLPPDQTKQGCKWDLSKNIIPWNDPQFTTSLVPKSCWNVDVSHPKVKSGEINPIGVCSDGTNSGEMGNVPKGYVHDGYVGAAGSRQAYGCAGGGACYITGGPKFPWAQAPANSVGWFRDFEV